MPNFAEFLAPFDPVEFKSHYYGKKPLHLDARGRTLDNPLTWRRLNDILELTAFWNEDTLKVFYQNRLALRDNYCDVGEIAPGEKAPANPRKVKALLGFGASLVANQIQRVSPDAAHLVQMLQREFAASAGANVYCSFQGVQAFNTHYDLHDVFALQTEGEKLWRIYEARADNPMASLPPGDEAEKWLVASRGRVLQEVLMKPGDLLYLPRGQYHDAVTGADASLHVTFWVKPATGLSLFKLLEADAALDSEFRAYLPDASNAAELGRHLARLAQQLERLMTSPSFAVEVRNHQRSLATSSATFELPARTRAQYYSTTKRGRVERRHEGFSVQIDHARIDVGACYQAVSWLLQQKLFSGDDLIARFPFIDERELQAVLQQLLQVGAIVETEMR
ncbi:JmjC domain-containing protein [Ideonella sp.]|uniref:JmjC domain-containing protein n=1 Tax=Ideonella sp. TaxID=1929293 RepID=UPI002B497553|nr:cupin domain-containing protein [Ideonella sp.]HJV70199.1 cupin domain-containing protein [Ideonella sp.]